MMFFEKVTKERFIEDFTKEFINVSHNMSVDEIYDMSVDEIYDKIQLPTRSTYGSAGYDFRTPIPFYLPAGETIKIPTGIKVCLDRGTFLMCVPRSGLGFKYRLQLDNTVAIIDEDYYNNPGNEGHIWFKLTNDSRDGKGVQLNMGDAMCQGIILSYLIVDDDNAQGDRVGGFGSTGGLR